jgi:hypothetical protein
MTTVLRLFKVPAIPVRGTIMVFKGAVEEVITDSTKEEEEAIPVFKEVEG